MTDKEAIINLNHIYGIVSSDIQRSLDLAIKALEERPQGEWIYTPDIHDLTEYECITCSICGNDSIGDFNFCPNCGADMRGVNNG